MEKKDYAMEVTMKKAIFSFLSMLVLILGTGCSKETSTSPPPLFEFAVTGEFKPFNFEEGEVLTGFDVEIGEEIAYRLGMDPKPLKVAKESLLTELKAGKYQAVISSLSITPERLKDVLFTQPYYETGAQCFILEDNTEIGNIEMLKDKRIGALGNTMYSTLAKSYTDKPQLYSSYADMLQDLTAGKIDAVIMDSMMGRIAKNEEGYRIQRLDGLLHKDEVGIAVDLNDSKLLDQINQALSDMKADGTFEKISLKWLGEG